MGIDISVLLYGKFDTVVDSNNIFYNGVLFRMGSLYKQINKKVMHKLFIEDNLRKFLQGFNTKPYNKKDTSKRSKR